MGQYTNLANNARLSGLRDLSTPLAASPGGGGGGGGVLNFLGKVLTTGQKTVGRVVEPLALELSQGADQLLANVPGALGSNARSNISARQDAGIRGFNLGELLSPGRDATGARVKLFDDPAFKDNNQILNGALRFGLDVAEDPLNLIGVGTAAKGAKVGTKMSAATLAKDVLAKTAGKGALLEEGGARAATILTTVQRERGLGAAVRAVSQIPEAKAAMEFAGYGTKRGLMLGSGKTGLIIPGTERLARGVDLMNEAARTKTGVSRILAKADAADWNLGQRARDIRDAAVVAEDNLAAGVPGALDEFRGFMEADAMRSVTQGRKGAIRDAMIKARQEQLGYTDDMVEEDIKRFRPGYAQRLRNGTGMTLKTLKGADANFVSSSLTGRLSGVYNGTGWTPDPNSPLHNLMHSVLDEIGTQLQSHGLTHHVRMNEVGDVIEISWNDMIDGLATKAQELGAKAKDSTFVAGSITADDLVWRLADTAAADIAMAQATGTTPALLKVIGGGGAISGKNWAHATNSATIDATKFFKATEQIDSVWKSMAVARPGFSNRNYWGGLASNMAYGVGVRYHREMAREAKAYLEDPQAYLAAATPRQMKIVEEIHNLGYDAAAGGLRISGQGVNVSQVGGSHVYFDVNPIRKFGSKLQENFELGTRIPFTKEARINPTAWPRAGVGGKASVHIPVELNLRLAAVMKFMDDGMSPEAARSLMEHVHFDYADLSKLDKSAKTIYPFWTFRSRNLPNQVENVAKGLGLSRGTIDAIVKGRMEHEGEPFPPFLQGIQVPIGGGRVLSSSALPLADLISRVQDGYTLSQGNVGDALRPTIINDALPQVRIPFEVLANRSSFTGETKKKDFATFLDTIVRGVPGTDLLPSPIPGVGRKSSFSKNSTVSDTALARFLENFARQFGQVGDVRDYSDTVN